MAADGSVVILIEGDDSDLKGKLNNIGNIASGAAKAAAAAIAGISTALVGAAAHAVKVGAEFEASMSNVAAISGATGDELEQLTERAKEMGAKTRFSASESAEAFTYMAMAGWETSDMLNGIEGIMNLAAASGESLATTSDIVTDALTAFGLSARDSGHFADVLATASNSANTNVAMLGESFKYVAPVAGALGYTAEDTAIALGLMANSGIKASQAGTVLRTAITNMTSPTEKMAAVMEEYGLSLTGADGTMLSLAEVMDQLRTTMGGLDETTQAAAASQLFGKEAMSGMLAIINASEKDYRDLTDAIRDADDAASAMAEIQLDNLSGQLDILKSAVEGFEIEFFQSVGNPITKTVTAAANAVSQLTATFRSEGLGSAIQELGGMAASAVAGLAAAAPSFIETAAGLVQSFLSGIRDNLPEIAASALEIVGSLAAGVVETLPELAQTGTDIILQLAQSIIDGLPGMVPAAVQTIASLVEQITGNLSQVIEAGIQVIVALGEGLIEALPDLIEKVPEIVSNIANVINDNAPKMLVAAAKLILELGVGLIKSIPTLIANIPKIIQAVVDVWSAFNWLDLGMKAITAIKDGILKMLSVVKSAGVSINDAVVNAIKNLPSKLAELGSKAITSLKNGILNIVPAVKTASKKILDAIINAVKSLPSDLAELGRNGITRLADTIRNLAGTAKNAMSNVFSGILDAVKSLPKKMLEIGGQIVQGIANGISNGAAAAINAVTDLASSVVNKAKSFLGINSPSRVMAREVGPYLPQGIAVGVEQEIPKVERSMAEQLAGLTDRVRHAVEAETANISVGLTTKGGGGNPHEPAPVSGGTVVNVYLESKPENTEKARNLGRELGAEAAREMRRRGAVPV